MSTPQETNTWRKSSHSNSSGDCIEVLALTHTTLTEHPRSQTP